MKFLNLAAAAAFATVLATSVSAQQASTAAQEFTAAAASSDMFEIQSSQAALEKSQNAAVREFAQMMINHHTDATAKLKTAAAAAGTTVPAEPNPKQEGMIQAVQTTPAGGFDGAYIDAQIAGHQEALALMNAYAQSGDSAPLQAHAQAMAPIVQSHLEMAQKIDAGM